MQKNILLTLIAVIVIGGGFYAFTNTSCEGASCQLDKPVTVLEDSTAGTEPGSSEDGISSDVGTQATSPSSNLSVSPTAGTPPSSVSPESTLPVADELPVIVQKGSYEAYSPDKIARAESGDVVLFFHASWCPSCRGLNSNIEVNRDSIPEGLTILKLDYDKEVELKKKYGVTTQHTLVQVDKDGNLIKKWSGGGSLTTIVNQVK